MAWLEISQANIHRIILANYFLKTLYMLRQIIVLSTCYQVLGRNATNTKWKSKHNTSVPTNACNSMTHQSVITSIGRCTDNYSQCIVPYYLLGLLFKSYWIWLRSKCIQGNNLRIAGAFTLSRLITMSESSGSGIHKIGY